MSFTGIIEEKGKVKSLSKNSICIEAKKVLEKTGIGDSIAVNGVCLTVTSLGDRENNFFTADVMPETFSRTNLGNLKEGSAVNLERAMAADGRFGGHIVSGHIDGRGKISRIENDGNAVLFWIEADRKIISLIVEKGSVAVDGISLTVAGLSASSFCVSVIPHTLSQTALGLKKTGDLVNLENDMIGKYVARLLGKNPEASGLTDNDEEEKSQAERDKKILAWLEG